MGTFDPMGWPKLYYEGKSMWLGGRLRFCVVIPLVLMLGSSAAWDADAVVAEEEYTPSTAFYEARTPADTIDASAVRSIARSPADRDLYPRQPTNEEYDMYTRGAMMEAKEMASHHSTADLPSDPTAQLELQARATTG